MKLKKRYCVEAWVTAFVTAYDEDEAREKAAELFENAEVSVDSVRLDEDEGNFEDY